MKEFDLILGYSTGGFSVSVTDYWYNVTGDGVTAKYFQYGAQYNSHLFEAKWAMISDRSINWYTNFAGDDGVDKDGDRAYSSYISISPRSNWADLTGQPSRRYPWATDFYGAKRFAVCDVSLGAIKDIKITNSSPSVVCQSNLESLV